MATTRKLTKPEDQQAQLIKAVKGACEALHRDLFVEFLSNAKTALETKNTAALVQLLNDFGANDQALNQTRAGADFFAQKYLNDQGKAKLVADLKASIGGS